MELRIFELKSPKLKVEILNLGGIIRKIETPDKNGIFENVVLGYENIEEYYKNPDYLGSLIGRTSGRIKNGEFILNNEKYTLAKNDGNNSLHGGTTGFNKVFWEVLNYTEDSILLSYTSRDGEEGYPGTVEAEVEYRIENEDELVVEYKAVSDKDTLIDLTQHSYFNLSGNYKRTSLEHDLKIPAKSFVEIDESGMITDVVRNVKDTSFDFNSMKNIGKNIDSHDRQIQNASGAYDHAFILDNSPNIELYDKISGRKMIVNTDAPAVIFYNSTKMGENMKLTGGINSRRFLGACLETQHVPNAVNFEGFEVPILKKDKTYKSKTVFKFSIVQDN